MRANADNAAAGFQQGASRTWSTSIKVKTVEDAGALAAMAPE